MEGEALVFNGEDEEMIENVFVWIPALVILAYLPLVVYLDLKYREIEHYNWAVMYTVCLPITGFLYAIGYYPTVLLPISFGAVTAYYILMRKGFFEGADFMFLAGISLFFVQNPISGLVLMPVSFGIFLMTAIILVNVITKFVLRTDKKFNQTFPMIIIISAAYVITLVLT